MKEINGKQPEVGDLFKKKKGKYRARITEITRVYIRFFDEKYIGSFPEFEDYADKDWFLNNYTYIGKAKNPITSIFEVE